MAKKSRRARRRASTAAQPVRLSRPATTEAKPKTVDFAAEYSYVIDDLRRIGITAVALLALLIALAIIIS